MSLGAGQPGRANGEWSLVVGKHEFDGWKVAVMGGDEPPILLTPAEAIELGERLIAKPAAGLRPGEEPALAISVGQELIAMAGVCEGKWGDD